MPEAPLTVRSLLFVPGGRSLGYSGKICLHPRQVTQAHRIFTPSPAEVAGAGVVEGEMVDEVHAKMAAAVLRRAGEQDAG